MTDPISKFMGRVKAAQQGRSKDVRLSIDEAQELTTAIGELLAIKLQMVKAEKPAETMEIEVDGGTF